MHVEAKADPSDKSREETADKLLEYFLESGRYDRLLKVAESEPPRVRAMLGAIGQFSAANSRHSAVCCVSGRFPAGITYRQVLRESENICRKGPNGDAASFSDLPSTSTADVRGAACATIPDVRPAGSATLRSRQAGCWRCKSESTRRPRSPPASRNKARPAADRFRTRQAVPTKILPACRVRVLRLPCKERRGKQPPRRSSPLVGREFSGFLAKGDAASCPREDPPRLSGESSQAS